MADNDEANAFLATSPSEKLELALVGSPDATVRLMLQVVNKQAGEFGSRSIQCTISVGHKLDEKTRSCYWQGELKNPTDDLKASLRKRLCDPQLSLRFALRMRSGPQGSTVVQCLFQTASLIGRTEAEVSILCPPLCPLF